MLGGVGYSTVVYKFQSLCYTLWIEIEIYKYIYISSIYKDEINKKKRYIYTLILVKYTIAIHANHKVCVEFDYYYYYYSYFCL